MEVLAADRADLLHDHTEIGEVLVALAVVLAGLPDDPVNFGSRALRELARSHVVGPHG